MSFKCKTCFKKSPKGWSFYIQNPTQSCTDCNRYPLHDAIDNKAPDGVILTLLQLYREAAKMGYSDGSSLLHIAIQSECSKEVILSLLEANTDAAKESDRDGYFPLHLAIYNGLSDDITLPIVKANKEAATKNCDRGLPLHMAIQSKCSNNVILATLAACKEAVKVSNGNGSFPLHLCIEFKLSSEITLAILAENKDAAKVTDQFGKLPLHNAIENGLSADIILSLLTANEGATKVKDGNGTLPLQKAIERKLQSNVILALLAANEEAAKERDNNGALMLQKAMKRKLDSSVILALLEANKQAAKDPDCNGALPLEKAIYLKLSGKIILALLKAYEGAAAKKDRNGALPLQKAIEHYSSNGLLNETDPAEYNKVILALIKANSDAVKEKDCDGIMLLHKAMGLNLDTAVIHALLKANEDASKERDDEAFPLHNVIYCNLDSSINLALLNANEKSAHKEAAKERDISGVLPLHNAMATKSILTNNIEPPYPAVKAPTTSKEKEYGLLSLHRAIKSKVSHDIILSILEKNNEAVTIESEDGELPLHLAIKNALPDLVVLKIFSLYPSAAMIRCKRTGMLPLHLASKSSASPFLVEALIKEYPEALEIVAYSATPRDLVSSALPTASIKMICTPYSDWKRLISSQRLEKACNKGKQSSELELLFANNYASSEVTTDEIRKSTKVDDDALKHLSNCVDSQENSDDALTRKNSPSLLEFIPLNGLSKDELVYTVKRNDEASKNNVEQTSALYSCSSTIQINGKKARETSNHPSVSSINPEEVHGIDFSSTCDQVNFGCNQPVPKEVGENISCAETLDSYSVVTDTEIPEVQDVVVNSNAFVCIGSNLCDQRDVKLLSDKEEIDQAAKMSAGSKQIRADFENMSGYGSVNDGSSNSSVVLLPRNQGNEIK